MSFERTEDIALSCAEVAEAQGALIRRSWRFRLVAAALLGLATLLRLAQEKDTSSRFQ